MSEEEDTYCRLCAEPTPKIQLIDADDDVAITSKIITKMLWINVDISTTNSLPNTICFSCFDLLEKTWSFLNNVRTAQEKLNRIFSKKSNQEKTDGSPENKQDNLSEAGRPVDKDWEEFQETKKEVKIENDNTNLDTITTVDPSTLINMDFGLVKCERQSDDEFPRNEADTDGFNTTDSDLPLHLAVKRKKSKKKRKTKYKSNIVGLDLPNMDDDASLTVSSKYKMSWDDYMCCCATCDAQCKNITSLRLHSLHIHSRCCTFKCIDCGKVIANHRTFINHVRLHKKVLRYFCEFCNKQFALMDYLKKHYNTEHRDAYLTTCQDCGTSFENEELLQDHMLIYSKGYKKTYRKRDKSEVDLKCEHCNKEFKSRSNLQQHKLVHTERSRDFSCHICGKMFFTKGTLSTHMQTHKDTKPFKCEFCPMAFRARGNLQSHVSLHSSAKPFVCEQCGKSFRVKRHLKSHSIVHTDLMPYVCSFCSKSFRFKTRLNLHVRQHTGAKPYKCVYCQRDFTNGSNFKKHMKRRHNIDTSKKRYNNIVNEQAIEINEEVDNSNQT